MVKISKCEMRIMHFIIKIHILYLTEKTDKTASQLFQAFRDCRGAPVPFRAPLVMPLLIYITCPFFSACSPKSFLHLSMLGGRGPKSEKAGKVESLCSLAETG